MEARVLTIQRTPNVTSILATISHGRPLRERMLLYDAMSAEERMLFDERVNKSANEAMLPFAEKRAKAQKIGYTSLLETDWAVTFESLEVIDQNRDAISRISKWSPEMNRGVVFWGSVGTGKSVACKAIINKWATPSYRCLFISVGEAMQALKDAIDDQENSVSNEENKLIFPDLLIFDDLGAEKSTEWAREKIFTIFEARARAKKHTFFTSNLSPEEMGKIYGMRIFDRMTEFCSWVKFDGESFRRRNYKAEI